MKNEETLMGDCCSYQERYMSCIDQINEQMKQYAVCTEDLNDIKIIYKMMMMNMTQ